MLQCFADFRVHLRLVHASQIARTFVRRAKGRGLNNTSAEREPGALLRTIFIHICRLLSDYHCKHSGGVSNLENMCPRSNLSSMPGQRRRRCPGIEPKLDFHAGEKSRQWRSRWGRCVPEGTFKHL